MLHAETATQKNLLFEHLLRATKQAIFESMTPLEVAAGTSIIKQGDTDAKTFYVLARGSCEVLLQTPDSGSEARQVLTYEPGRYPPLHVYPASMGQIGLGFFLGTAVLHRNPVRRQSQGHSKAIGGPC